MKRLHVHLFGYPRLFLDDAPLKFDRKKTLALAAYLAVQPDGEGVSRDTAAALLWPDCSQEQAAAYLRQSLWDFNKAAGEGWIDRSGAVLALGTTETVWVDAVEFTAGLSRWQAGTQDMVSIQALHETADLYQEDFLAGFSLKDSPEFDDWQSLKAEGYKVALSGALQSLTQAAVPGSGVDPLQVARRWVALDPLNEAAHRDLMRLLAAGGQLSAALRQYEACQKILRQELGVQPEPATEELFAAIKASRAEPVAAPPPRAARARPPVPTFLPRQRTDFIGRESEISLLKERLSRPGSRLLTLLGPGGSGKTRLAIEAASQCSGFPYNTQYTHGIYFAGLAAVRSPDEIVGALGSALKITFRSLPGQVLHGDEARDQLMAHLAGKELLLVIDNFEHLLSGAGLLSDLLAAAPGLRLLVTSRARLGLPEERIFEVDGLPFPDSEGADDLRSFAAVQLFCAVAERVSGSAPLAEDLPAAARICRLVEGMPLGIEMAAGWTRLLGCGEIAAEISRSLDFLESGGASVDERHQTLRAVFEYSWALLNEMDRGVLSRLSVFQGGFSREAALEVAGASLRSLAALVDHSLLRRVTSSRFDLHELIKQYAAEKLAASPEAAGEVSSRYVDYFLKSLEGLFEQMKGADLLPALAVLRGDQQNIRKVWGLLARNNRFDAIERILPLVILLHDLNGISAEAPEVEALLKDLIARLKAAITTHPEEPSLRACLGLAVAGLRRFSIGLAQEEGMKAYRREALAALEGVPDTSTKAYALLLCAFSPGRITEQEAKDLCGQAVSAMEALGDDFGAALAYEIQGDALNFDFQSTEQSEASYRQALKRFDRLQCDWGRGLCLYGLGLLFQRKGETAAAYEAMKASLEIHERINDPDRAIMARSSAGDLAVAMGNLNEARRFYETNLSYFMTIGNAQACDHFRAKLRELGSSPH